MERGSYKYVLQDGLSDGEESTAIRAGEIDYNGIFRHLYGYNLPGYLTKIFIDTYHEASAGFTGYQSRLLCAEFGMEETTLGEAYLAGIFKGNSANTNAATLDEALEKVRMATVDLVKLDSDVAGRIGEARRQGYQEAWGMIDDEGVAEPEFSLERCLEFCLSLLSICGFCTIIGYLLGKSRRE